MRRVVWAGALVGALATACGSNETPAEPTPPATAEPTPPATAEPTPPPPTTPDPEHVQDTMQGHFSRATSAHDALIRADMEQARADMAWLATHEEPSLPAELQPLLDNMQAEAARFPEATTLTEAGTTFARMLVRCGECHTTSHGGPEIAQTPIPEGDTPEARMRRHQWASDRMFDGLVTANADIFRSGNDALTSAPLTQADLPGTEAQPAEQVAMLTTHVRELGAEAANAADEQARANIYGRYLATCGACHRLIEGGAPAALQPAAGGTAPAPTTPTTAQ